MIAGFPITAPVLILLSSLIIAINPRGRMQGCCFVSRTMFPV